MSKKMSFNPKAITGNISETINTIEAKDEFSFRNINIDLIDPSEKNDYKLEAIEELAENIKLIGLQQNLVVRPKEDGRFELITGHRRFEALKVLNSTKVPCKVEEKLKNDDIAMEYSMHSTNQMIRKEDDMSKAKHIKRMKELLREMKKNGHDIKGRVDQIVGKDLGLSSMQVQRLDKLNNLIPELQQMVSDSKLTSSKAVHFASMDKEAQLVILEMLNNNIDISREEAQKLKLELKKKDEEKEQEIQKSKEEYQEELNKLLSKNKELEKEKETLIDEKETLIDENEKLSNQIKAKEEAYEKLNSDIDKIQEKIKIEAEKEATNNSKQKLEELQKEKNKLFKEKTLMDAEIKNLKKNQEAKNEIAKKELDEIQKNIEIKYASNEFLTAIMTFSSTMATSETIIISEENQKILSSIKQQFEKVSKYIK